MCSFVGSCTRRCGWLAVVDDGRTCLLPLLSSVHVVGDLDVDIKD